MRAAITDTLTPAAGLIEGARGEMIVRGAIAVLTSTPQWINAALLVLGVLLTGCEPSEAAFQALDVTLSDLDDAATASDLREAIPRCVPGASERCACVDGRWGAQTCETAGRFSACRCAESAVDGSVLDVPLLRDTTPSEVPSDAAMGGILGPMPPHCVPGASQACSCFDARLGAQVCRADGSFDPCYCFEAMPDDGGSAPRADAAASSGRPVEVVVGWSHSCARRADGAVFCWGSGEYTATGSAPEATHLTPTRAVGIEDVTALIAPTCALRRDRTPLCWSCPECAVTGRPAERLPHVVAGVSDVTSMSSVYGPYAFHRVGTCYFSSGAPPLCVGTVVLPGVNPFQLDKWRPGPDPGFLPTLTPFDDVADVAEIAGVAGTVCARQRSGQVLCWGAGGDTAAGGYQLGDGLTRHASDCGTAPLGAVYLPVIDCSLVPVRVLGVVDAVELVSGGAHCGASHYGLCGGRFCVRHASGRVSCWGSNDQGQLGDGTTIDRARPVSVVGLSGVIRLAADGPITCALLRDGTVRCWGTNREGQLGDGRASHDVPDAGPEGDYSPTPVHVVGLDHVAQIAVSKSHACALRDDGHLFCWGANEYGQLGNNSATGSTVPVEVRWP